MGEYDRQQMNQLNKAIRRSESKNSQLKGFVDNRPHAASQMELINSIQKKPNNNGLPNNLKSGIENLSGYSIDVMGGKSLQLESTYVIQKAGPDFADHEIEWIPTGTRIEAHCPWLMTHLAIRERLDEIKPWGGVNALNQQQYMLTWPIMFHEEFGEGKKKPNWKDGCIIFSYDPINKRAYVFHSGPGG